MKTLQWPYFEACRGRESNLTCRNWASIQILGRPGWVDSGTAVLIDMESINDAEHFIGGFPNGRDNARTTRVALCLWLERLSAERGEQALTAYDLTATASDPRITGSEDYFPPFARERGPGERLADSLR